MEGHLKTRLIGAIITVLVLALILPNVLDGNEQRDRLLTQIPAKPPTPDWVEEGDTKRVRIQMDELASGEFEKRISAPAPKDINQDDPKVPQVPVDRGGLDENSMPVSWTLQMGAFQDVANATRFRDKLRAKGFKAYSLRSANGQLERVFVGPVIQRSKAESLRKQLTEELAIDGVRIQQYQPE